MSDDPRRDDPTSSAADANASLDLSDADAVVFDVDGVLALGENPIPGALETLTALEDAGKRLYFVTNVSSMGEEAFVQKFERLGYGRFARPGRMWTSCMATSRVLRDLQAECDGGMSAFVIGSDGLKAEIEASGVRLVKPTLTEEERTASPVDMSRVELDPTIRAVVVGFDVSFCYFHLAYAVRCLLELPAVKFVVPNRDYQYPVGGVRTPGNGALVAAVVASARREPDIVAAKPSPFLYSLVLDDCGIPAARTLMVGDLWSDIAFGHRAGARSVLVLSGVSKLEDANSWDGEQVPDAVLHDVRGLLDNAHVVRGFDDYGGGGALPYDASSGTTRTLMGHSTPVYTEAGIPTRYSK